MALAHDDAETRSIPKPLMASLAGFGPGSMSGEIVASRSPPPAVLPGFSRIAHQPPSAPVSQARNRATSGRRQRAGVETSQ